jgi:glycosyltransferase involved in cell wall biosynthesis
MTEPIVIIFTFRNRDQSRVENCFQSLLEQTNLNFRVEFVDYGSKQNIAEQIKSVVEKFSFTNYNFLPYLNQPWNKSRALNYIIKSIKESYFLVADIDMVFHPEFVEKLHKLKNESQITFFKVGYLSKSESAVSKSFDLYSIKLNSKIDAKGISLFPTNLVKNINGFDEFFHFWGAEDVDIHFRLVNNGFTSIWYDKEILLLHQWHPSYMMRQRNKLTKELQVENIIRINHEHLKFNLTSLSNVNSNSWGEVYSQDDFANLTSYSISAIFGTEKEVVDHFLYGYLHSFSNQIIAVRFKSNEVSQLRNFVKKCLGRKVITHYSLKQINDKILLHLISYYRNNLYTLEIADNFEWIDLKLKID